MVLWVVGTFGTLPCRLFPFITLRRPFGLVSGAAWDAEHSIAYCLLGGMLSAGLAVTAAVVLGVVYWAGHEMFRSH